MLHLQKYHLQNEYCQQIIRQRQIDGIFDRSPIFGSIESFISEGYAKQYKGMVDIITAGFPCQGWSAPGEHKGESDERNKWPETREAIDIIRPREVLLENSPNIMSKGFIFQIIQDLSSLGYVGRATRISGLHVGASSKRVRCWIKASLSNSDSNGLEGRNNRTKEWEASIRSIQGLGKNQIRVDLPDSRLFRDYNDAATRKHRLEGIGNAQTPINMALAYAILSNEFARDNTQEEVEDGK